MRPSEPNKLPILAEILAVLLCLVAILGLTMQSAAAQFTEYHIDDALRAAIEKQGSVRAIIQMRMADSGVRRHSGAENLAPEGTIQSLRARAAQLRANVSAARREIAYDLALAGIEVDRSFDHLPFLVSTLTQDQLEMLAETAGVIGVFEDRMVRATDVTPQQEQADAQPSLFFSRQDVRAEEAWNQGATGQGQAVVVLDTGVSAVHPMFNNKIVAEACFSTTFLSSHTSLCPSGSSQQTGPGTATLCPSGSLGVCSHGSHVAGIAVGNDPNDPTDGRGIAIDADLIPMQVFTRIDDEDVCTEDGEDPTQRCLVSFTSAHLAGLNHTIDLIEDFDIAAVNMSFGGEPITGSCNQTPLKSATDTLRALGIAVVAASGNDGEVGQMNDPACISGVISVGAIIITIPTSFTNVSELTDLMAPGFSIKSARVGSGYQFASGTSMSTPHVAGAFAILKSAHPTATVSEMEDALENGGPATAIQGADYTVPRLDISAGLALLDPAGNTEPAPPPEPGAVAATVLLNVDSSPVFGPEAHIRIFNPTGSSGVVTADIRDSETGESLGVWTSSSIEPSASPQFAISDIEQNMTPEYTPSPNTPRYTLFLTADFEGYVQHVSWDPAAGFLTNLTACNTTQITRPLDLFNVHTTQVQSYPSSIVIFNAGLEAAEANVRIHLGDSGELLANWTSPEIEVQGSRSFSMTSIQNSAQLLPISTELHYTLRLDSAFDGFAQHFVDNTIADIRVNMTAACALTTS